MAEEEALSAVRDHEMVDNDPMPPSRSDRQVLIFATIIVIVAGLVAAGLIFLATGGTNDTPKTAPLFLGLEPELSSTIGTGGPLYFANPFGGRGFWLDQENGKIVALAIDLPKNSDCLVKWRDSRKAYVDCNGNKFQVDDLDRYLVSVGSVGRGSPKDSLYVDLRVRTPPPSTITP